MCMRVLLFCVAGCCIPPSFPRYPPRNPRCAFFQGIFCDRGGGSSGREPKNECTHFVSPLGSSACIFARILNEETLTLGHAWRCVFVKRVTSRH